MAPLAPQAPLFPLASFVTMTALAPLALLALVSAAWRSWRIFAILTCFGPPYWIHKPMSVRHWHRRIDSIDSADSADSAISAVSACSTVSAVPASSIVSACSVGCTRTSTKCDFGDLQKSLEISSKTGHRAARAVLDRRCGGLFRPLRCTDKAVH